MIRLEAGCEELRADHSEVFVNLEDFSFSVEVVNSRHLDAPSRDSESGVLDDLEFADGSGTGVGEPYWSCIHK